MKKCRLLKSNNYAISEVFGTILILAISVSLFSLVYVSLLSVDVEESSPEITIIGTIEDNYLLLEHRGGESLDLTDRILLTLLDGSRVDLLVNDVNGTGFSYLPIPNKNDGSWDIGERFTLPLTDITNFNRYDPIDLSVIDVESNSMVMSGTVQEFSIPLGNADLMLLINMDITNDYPVIVTFTLKIVHLGDGMGGLGDIAEDIIINDFIPEGLEYLEHRINGDIEDTYTPPTNGYGIGQWYIGSMVKDEICGLIIRTRVTQMSDEALFTQLFFMIDGSNSISSTQYSNILHGVAEAIRDDIIPHDGSVEIAVLQLAHPPVFNPYGPQYMTGPEIGPIVLKDKPGTINHYEDIANTIEGIIKVPIFSLTPIQKGFMLAHQTIFQSYNYQEGYRQVINLVSDGKASYKYQGPPPTTDDENVKAMQTAVEARDILVADILNSDIDAINCFELGGNYGSNHNWMKDPIVFPQPAIEGIPQPGDKINGFVVNITDAWDVVDLNILEEAIEKSMQTECYERNYAAEITQSSVHDPDSSNNNVEISYIP